MNILDELGGTLALGGNIRIMAVRAGYKNQAGDGVLADTDSAAAIGYAAQMGARVISMSWGLTTPSPIIEQVAIPYAQSQDCVLIAAAGNEGSDSEHYPAAYDGVIAVAASDESDGKASFSNYGSWVHIAAPGISIYSTYFDDTYADMYGTSMATPFVAGVAGLILSRNLTLTADEVTQTLLDSADNIQWAINGNPIEPAKRLNAYQALLLVEPPPPPGAPPHTLWGRGSSSS